jgi:magnesium-transporting ATPase (P-type)
MTEWFRGHTLITYVLIFVLAAYVYHKVFATRRLPILKLLLVYAVMAFGCLLLLIFQVDAGLPIVPSLAVAVVLMAMTRVRALVEKRQGSDSSEPQHTEK